MGRLDVSATDGNRTGSSASCILKLGLGSLQGVDTMVPLPVLGQGHVSRPVPRSGQRGSRWFPRKWVWIAPRQPCSHSTPSKHSGLPVSLITLDGVHCPLCTFSQFAIQCFTVHKTLPGTLLTATLEEKTYFARFIGEKTKS